MTPPDQDTPDQPQSAQSPSSPLLPAQQLPESPESAPPLPDSGDSPANLPTTSGPLFPSPQGKAKHGRRVNREQYDAIYTDWLAGMRKVDLLSAKYGFAWETIRKLIRVGSRLNGWPSFAERRVAEDSAVKDARSQAAPVIAQMIVDDYEKVRRENLSIVAGMKAGTTFIVRKYIDAARLASFVKTRKVRDKTGAMITIEVPMDAAEAADVGRTLMQLVEGLARVESFAMGGPSERLEVSRTPVGWDSLTESQLQWVIDHGGQLPPDIDPSSLFGPPPATSKPDLKLVK